jgi:hypothetical protein
MSNSLIIEPPAQSSALGLLGDEQIIAVEAFIGEDLIGGIQLEFEVPQQESIHLPIILKKLSRT